MDPSAIAARRARLSLALTAGGAIVLTAGVTMMLIGEALKLEPPAGWQQLIPLGGVLAAIGLAIGLACAVVVLSGPYTQASAGAPSRPSGEMAGSAGADFGQSGNGEAGYDGTGHDGGGYEGAGYEAAGYERSAAYGSAGKPEDYFGPQYSDEGWRLDGTGPAPAGAPPPVAAAPPPPAAAPPPAAPPREIHHPVRPMAPPRPPGQRLGADTGQLPAYDAEARSAYGTGQHPAYLSAPPGESRG